MPDGIKIEFSVHLLLVYELKNKCVINTASMTQKSPASVTDPKSQSD